MNKIKYTACLAAILLLAGCASHPKVKYTEVSHCTHDGVAAPAWTCVPPHINGKIFAIGSAPTSSAGPSFTMAQAMSNARNALIFKMKSTAKGEISNYVNITGLKSSQSIDRVAKHVDDQLTGGVLKMVRRVNYWQNPKNKNVFVLVSIERKKFKSFVIGSVRNGYDNKSVQWQDAKAKKAVKQLNVKVGNSN